MEFNEYQSFTRSTRVYPEQYKIIYAALGLNGEAGECAEHAKKILRDDNCILTPERRDALIKEIGDVMWYMAALCDDIDVDMSTVASVNIAKLTNRKEQGTLGGSGSDR